MPNEFLRLLQLARYSKGGLGDVRLLDMAEFETFYMSMLELHRMEEDEMKRRREEK
ncbi:hypothetical protein [Deinococcus kurensis]|uniref:hypothetical protein n=1 Tax=Deinococcus kurensis TaxID=2662757 RepID=UPI0012D3260B|nr:hypothetical protein [Deinococcus kurensis]